ncbi:MAG: hypothetical protein V3U21_01085 [Thermodesulfobacteriota bacterium]
MKIKRYQESCEIVKVIRKNDRYDFTTEAVMLEQDDGNYIAIDELSLWVRLILRIK